MPRCRSAIYVMQCARCLRPGAAGDRAPSRAVTKPHTRTLERLLRGSGRAEADGWRTCTMAGSIESLAFLIMLIARPLNPHHVQRFPSLHFCRLGERARDGGRERS